MENIISNIETALHWLGLIKNYLGNQNEIISRRNQNELIAFDENDKILLYERQINSIMETHVIGLANSVLRERKNVNIQLLSFESNELTAKLRTIAAMLVNQRKRRQMIGEEQQIIIDESGQIKEFGWKWLKKVNQEAINHLNLTEKELNKIKIQSAQ